MLFHLTSLPPLPPVDPPPSQSSPLTPSQWSYPDTQMEVGASPLWGVYILVSRSQSGFARLCTSDYLPLIQVLRYKVYSDLWRKGKYLTNGAKYGGDFLVYSGDPCLVHSDYVALVLPWQQPISNLVSLGHLGSKVRKNTLLCSVTPESDEVTYFSLEWSRLQRTIH